MHDPDNVGAIKTEHSGAKHAQGYWGPKAVAKEISRRRRRRADRAAVRAAMNDREI